MWSHLDVTSMLYTEYLTCVEVWSHLARGVITHVSLMGYFWATKIGHSDIFCSNSFIIRPIFKLFFSNFRRKSSIIATSVNLRSWWFGPLPLQVIDVRLYCWSFIWIYMFKLCYHNIQELRKHWQLLCFTLLYKIGKVTT